MVDKTDECATSVFASDYLPPRTAMMGGNWSHTSPHEFMVPAKPKTLLCKLWGTNWRSPVKDTHTKNCNPDPLSYERLENETIVREQKELDTKK